MLDCILFDLDGLIIDSEPLQFRAYRPALEQFGYQLDLETWASWHRVEASTARWVRDQQLELDPQVLRAVKKNYYETLIAEELELKPGARELIEACAHGCNLAVVSGSRRESIESCLQKFDLERHFDEFVSGVDLPRSKPYPDAYLEALRIMKIDAANAIAIEDSPTGLQAATTAGIVCIACPDDFMPKAKGAFAGAALVVDSLLDLDPERLRQIHAGHFDA